ncbi:hypothetical protein AUJ42_00390 [Candidatus Collierbacteria bacterium CG1_02_44_10]|uniref:Uncharacterized protein n=1 Tax=Candidatus Collierbacteria bacterium CG1_02_44_10 TaxID=1805087 RepID=A0A1J4RZB0_9BACT|nr:MAG: hypothetical protein AUJ42_00390 [Candidatus Collierbacteria bacterium CG1_02_44_10]
MCFAMSGTSRPGGAVRVFGPGVGLANEIDMALGKVERPPTPQELQRIVIDPQVREAVVAALRGQWVIKPMDFGQLCEREGNYIGIICEMAGVNRPSDSSIEAALRKAEKEWGGLTEHDRVIPAGLTLGGLRQLFIAFNETNAPGFKLYDSFRNRWWAENKDIQLLPTQLGVIRLDLGSAMLPTNLAGHPYFLSYEEQEVWAKAQGGDGLTSVEETLCVFSRSGLEFQRPLWPAGSCRCRNSYGGAHSLSVDWDAANGLFVDRWYRDDHDWYLGALARKYTGA